MTHPPASPEPLDVIAEWLHEHRRERHAWWPAWVDLDPTDPFEAGLIQTGYNRAQAWLEISGEE